MEGEVGLDAEEDDAVVAPAAEVAAAAAAFFASSSHLARRACIDCSSTRCFSSKTRRRSFFIRSINGAGNRSNAFLQPSFQTPDGFDREKLAGTIRSRLVTGEVKRMEPSSAAAEGEDAPSLASLLSPPAAFALTSTDVSTSPDPDASMKSTYFLCPCTVVLWRPDAAGSQPVSKIAQRTPRPSYSGNRDRNNEACVSALGTSAAAGNGARAGEEEAGAAAAALAEAASISVAVRV